MSERTQTTRRLSISTWIGAYARPGVLCTTDEEFEAELQRANQSATAVTKNTRL